MMRRPAYHAGMPQFLVWLIPTSIILLALVHALRHPWDAESGVPRWTRVVVPLVLAGLAIGVITWVTLLRS